MALTSVIDVRAFLFLALRGHQAELDTQLVAYARSGEHTENFRSSFEVSETEAGEVELRTELHNAKGEPLGVVVTTFSSIGGGMESSTKWSD